MKLEKLIGQIQLVDKGLKYEANKAVNQLLTIRNWLIGYYIVEYEQHGEDRAKYGDKLLKTLAEKLNNKGLSYRNLKLFRQFYQAFPEIGQTLSAFLEKNIQTPSELFIGTPNQIVQTLSAQLPIDIKRQTVSAFSEERILLASKMLQSLSFSHITLLLPLNDDLKRIFYIIETIKGVWSVRELKRQINTLLFERSGMSKKPELLIQSINKNYIPPDNSGLAKDIYTFEFLGLPIKDAVEETELESALLDHIREFMLELGDGFCMEARQKRILIGGKYYFIDLVFYHRILKCHILIDLKVDEFDHVNAGQLNTYLNYYKKEVQLESDNEPIGILMVTDKNDALVEYAIAGMDQNIFISKYLLQLPSKEKFEQFIRDELKRI